MCLISFITVNDGKVAILTAVTEDLINSVSAVDLARVGSIAVGGKGGGGNDLTMKIGGGEGGNGGNVGGGKDLTMMMVEEQMKEMQSKITTMTKELDELRK